MIGYPQAVGRNRVKYGTVIEGIRRITLLDQKNVFIVVLRNALIFCILKEEIYDLNEW